MKCRCRVWLGALVVTLGLWGSAGAQEAKPNAAAQPVSREADPGWLERHQAMNERAKQGNVDLLFLGDSITQGWEGDGKEVWTEFYAKRNALNLGIGGDRTQHVLWRLDNGNLNTLAPKLAVVMIGTNNATQNTPEETAEGIKQIVEKLRSKLPQTKVLLLAVFPRGPNPQDPARQANEKTNQLIATLADGNQVRFQDLGPKFLEPDGTLNREIMGDLVHLTGKGYRIWAEAIEPVVAEVVGPKEPASTPAPAASAAPATPPAPAATPAAPAQ